MSLPHPPPTAIRPTWLIPTSMIAPGKSALMGGPTSFWIIHLSGISTLILSMLASAAVLMHIFDIPLPCFLSLRTKGLFRAIGDSKRSPWPVLGRRNNHPANTSGEPDPPDVAEEKYQQDIASRFAMYLAFADFCWSCVHMSDHLYLAVRQVFPSLDTSQTFALLVSLFYGYQQMTHSVLALFTYLRVSRRTHIELGNCDWRLHAICFGPIAIGVVIYGNLDAFGAFGYWCLSNANTTSGKLISFTVFALSLWTAIVTTTSHYLIATKINHHLRALDDHADPSAAGPAVYPVRRLYGTPEHPPATPEPAPTLPQSAHAKPFKLTLNTAALGIDSGGWSRPCAGVKPAPSPTSPSSMRHPPGYVPRPSVGGQTPPHSPHLPHSPTTLLSSTSSPGFSPAACAAIQCKRWWVASQCLNNLIRAAVWVYVPLAVGSYIVATFHVLGYVEPVSSWCVAVLANATGFVNAYAYFSNEVLKARLRVPVEEVRRRVMADVPERPGRAGGARGA